MFVLARYFRSAVIAVGLASLAIVLAPSYTEPLWHWTTTVAGIFTHDPLPNFAQTQHWSSLALAAFVVAGIGYNLLRDRRQRILQAEYNCRTGATQLKGKVADLQADLRRVTAERDRWQDSYLSLTRKHTDALVAAKEHEVRSEYGRCAHEALGELRKEFDTLMHSKGHVEGFREAMHFFLASMSEAGQRPEVTVEATLNDLPTELRGKDKRAALPFAPPQGL
jgi:hypothetical protein